MGGCWSDDYGRKPTLMLGPAMNVISSFLYAFVLPQTLRNVFLLLFVGEGANAISGSTTTIAAIIDICRGDRLMMQDILARFGGWVGIGAILGPATGGLSLARTKQND